MARRLAKSRRFGRVVAVDYSESMLQARPRPLEARCFKQRLKRRDRVQGRPWDGMRTSIECAAG